MRCAPSCVLPSKSDDLWTGERLPLRSPELTSIPRFRAELSRSRVADVATTDVLTCACANWRSTSTLSRSAMDSEIADRASRSSSPQKSKPRSSTNASTCIRGHTVRWYEMEMEMSARSSVVPNAHPATMPPAREHRVRHRVAHLDPAGPPVRLERQPKDAERMLQRDRLDPQLHIGDHLAAFPKVEEDRDAAPIVAGMVLCPGGLAPDRVDRHPAARARKGWMIRLNVVTTRLCPHTEKAAGATVSLARTIGIPTQPETVVSHSMTCRSLQDSCCLSTRSTHHQNVGKQRHEPHCHDSVPYGSTRPASSSAQMRPEILHYSCIDQRGNQLKKSQARHLWRLRQRRGVVHQATTAP